MSILWHKTLSGGRYLIPERAGVYTIVIQYPNGNVSTVYVGQAKNLKARMDQHFSVEEENSDLKAFIRQYPMIYIFWAEVWNDVSRDRIELYLYNMYKPCCNKIAPPALIPESCNLPL